MPVCVLRRGGVALTGSKLVTERISQSGLFPWFLEQSLSVQTIGWRLVFYLGMDELNTTLNSARFIHAGLVDARGNA